MTRISKTFYFLSLACLTLSSCAYNCSCDETIAKQNKSPTSQLIPEGAQLLNECSYIDESIADSITFSKKMANSRYAIYYQAMSRERVSELQARSKEISCP
jgi:hypothetical protein